jgi:hypothetical protein
MYSWQTFSPILHHFLIYSKKKSGSSLNYIYIAAGNSLTYFVLFSSCVITLFSKKMSRLKEAFRKVCVLLLPWSRSYTWELSSLTFLERVFILK